MALNRRERTLAIVAGGASLIVAANFVYGMIRTSFEDRQNRIEALEQEISTKKAAETRGKLAVKKLEGWRKRSLPADPELARSLYKNWLAGIMEKSGLGAANIAVGADIPRQGVYTLAPFTVRGQGTMTQIVQLLHDFYQADHLHRVKQVTLTPAANAAPGANGAPGGMPGFPGGGMPGFPGGGAMFDLTLAIEALALPGADRRDTLNDAQSERLAWKGQAQYSQPIVSRDFFAPFTPAPPEVDPAIDVYLTAVVRSKGKLLAWVNFREAGRLMKLTEGEKFDLGASQATIAKITTKGVEIEADGRRKLVYLGKNLAESPEVGAVQ